MSAAVRRHRVSEEEFLSLPESSERVELVDGEVVLSPAPLPRHQVLLFELALRVRRWASDRPPAFVGIAPFDVKLGPNRIVQPDLFVRLAGRPPLDQLFEGVPDLVIEVLSSRASYDRMTKRVLYADAGVSEFWLVDPLDRTVEVVHGIETVGTHTERVVSSSCPGLELELPVLFSVLD